MKYLKNILNIKSKMIKNSCKCKENIPKFAENDIKCYKVIRRDHNGQAKALYIDKFYNSNIKEGDIIYAPQEAVYSNWFERHILRKPIIKGYIEEGIEWNSENNWYDITFGFLHSTPNEIFPKEIEHYIEWFTPKCEIELWECVIPKGTKYYQADCRGSHFESSNSYASKYLKFVKLIHKKTLDTEKCGGCHIY